MVSMTAEAGRTPGAIGRAPRYWREPLALHHVAVRVEDLALVHDAVRPLLDPGLRLGLRPAGGRGGRRRRGPPSKEGREDEDDEPAAAVNARLTRAPGGAALAVARADDQQRQRREEHGEPEPDRSTLPGVEPAVAAVVVDDDRRHAIEFAASSSERHAWRGVRDLLACVRVVVPEVRAADQRQPPAAAVFLASSRVCLASARRSCVSGLVSACGSAARLAARRRRPG